MTLEEQFSHENIINNLAKYEMYYQVSLGSLISDTKTKEINPEIELQYALGSIYEFISEIKSLENVNEIFESELQKQAAMDALQNFVNENLDLVKNAGISIEPIVNAINDKIFFHKSMIEICDNNLESQILKWAKIIDKNLAEQILESIKEMQD